MEGCWYEERQHGAHVGGNAVDHKDPFYRFRNPFSSFL
jgi:hypothetical protein